MRARLSTEARSKRHVRQRQAGLVDDLARVQIRDRHLGCRDEVAVAAIEWA